MEICGDELTECLAEDMLPGHYYLSEDSNRNIVLPLDTEGNVVIFSKEFRYYDSYEKGRISEGMVYTRGIKILSVPL